MYVISRISHVKSVISRISHVRTPHGYVKPYATLALQSTLYRALIESTHTHALP